MKASNIVLAVLAGAAIGGIIAIVLKAESALTENGPTTVMVEVYTNKNGKIERKLQTIQLGKVKQNENLVEIMIE